MRESPKDLAPRSRCLEAFDFREGAVFEPSTGLFVGRSGHRYSWSRGGSSLAGVAALNTTYTAPATLPAYEMANGSLGVLLGTNDAVRGNVLPGWPWQELSGELLFVERGARIGTAGDTIFAIAGDDPTVNNRLYIDTTGSGSGFYRLTVHNGTFTASCTLVSGQPTAGQLVRLRFGWSQSASFLRQSINGGAFTSATAGAVALPTVRYATERVRIGRRGATANPAPLTFISLMLLPGTLTDAQFDEAY